MSVSGGGLTWIAGLASGSFGEHHIFYAFAPTAITNQTITADFGGSSSYYTDRTLVVSVYHGTDLNSPIGAMVSSTGSGTSISSTLTTTRANSLVLSGVEVQATTTFTAGSGETVSGQINSATSGLAATRRSSMTATVGTSVTSSVTSSANANFYIRQYEILTPQPAVSVPTFDAVFTGDNGGGSNLVSTGNITTAGGNELIIAVVSWRSASALTSPLTFYGGTPATLSQIATLTQGTVSTSIYCAFATTKISGISVNTTGIPASAKATVMVAAFRGVYAGGTNNCGGVEVLGTAQNNTANPSSSITTLTPNSLVLSILGLASSGAPTAGTGFTVNSNVSTSSGGGAAGTKSSLTLEIANGVTATPSSVTSGFTQGAIDWTKFDLALRP